MIFLRFIIINIAFISLLGCQERKGIKVMGKPTEIEFKLGQSFESFNKKYPSLKVSRQPIGATFYKLDWPEITPATIIFKMGEYQVGFPYTISMSTMESDYKSSEGITKFRFKSGITDDKTITHKEARLKFHELLQGLLGKGWKRSLYYGYPRLKGSQAMHYTREIRSAYPLDPNYLPTMKEWMALKNMGTRWELYASNKAFMNIVLQRKSSETNPDVGIYLLSIEIINDQEMGLSHFLPEDKIDWGNQEKWDSAKGAFLKKRMKLEKDLLSKGYEIDESYEDYEIIPALSK